jgi:hypothetical protein
MPLRDQRAGDIYQAVHAVIEDRPYFWRIAHPTGGAEAPGVWPDLQPKLLRASCYIAVLTGESTPTS